MVGCIEQWPSQNHPFLRTTWYNSLRTTIKHQFLLIPRQTSTGLLFSIHELGTGDSHENLWASDLPSFLDFSLSFLPMNLKIGASFFSHLSERQPGSSEIRGFNLEGMFCNFFDCSLSSYFHLFLPCTYQIEIGNSDRICIASWVFSLSICISGI